MRPIYRYQMDFKGKWTRWSLLLMALSFFFYMVYSFGVSNLADTGLFKAVFVMLLPTILTAGYIVLLKIKELNAPGIYGLIGAGLCLCALFCTFFTGNAVQIVLGILWYPICALLLLAAVGGYLPSVTSVACAFGISIFVRFLFLLGSGYDLDDFVGEIAIMFSSGSLLCLPFGLRQGRIKN